MEKKGPSTPSKPQRKPRVQLDDDDDSEYEAPTVAPEDDFMDIGKIIPGSSPFIFLFFCSASPSTSVTLALKIPYDCNR